MSAFLNRVCRIPERWLARAAQRRALSMTLIGLLAFTGSALAAWSTHIPVPSVHDEFSYLLAADTFAHGRLTNPPHPMWMHFESLHIIQRPTYASKYPPAQGVVLAFGQVVGGHPIVGVWLGAGLGCVAIYWMLLGWLPPRWALLGAVIVLLRIGIPSYWSQSYWGGWLAALGGALVFGALPRLARNPRVRDSLLMGAGLAILANSRPYEGLVVSLPAVLALGVVLFRKRHSLADAATRRALMPMSIVIVCTAGAVAVYNARVTGSATQLPYQVHETTYAMKPMFLWQSPRLVPEYRHKPMRDYQVAELEVYTQQRSAGGFVRGIGHKGIDLFRFYLGTVLVLPLLFVPWLLGNRRMLFVLLTCVFFGAALLLETHMFPHYAAPATGLIYLLLVQSLRHVRLFRLGSLPLGRLAIWIFPVACAWHLWTSFALPILGYEPRWASERAALQSQLERDGNWHLVIVRYGATHPFDHEWVYNGADIDGERVVWAREMDADHNRRLLDYFADRQPWLLEADRPDPSLVPYPSASN